jgi:hypothetical protein
MKRRKADSAKLHTWAGTHNVVFTSGVSHSHCKRLLPIETVTVAWEETTSTDNVTSSEGSAYFLPLYSFLAQVVVLCWTPCVFVRE